MGWNNAGAVHWAEETSTCRWRVLRELNLWNLRPEIWLLTESLVWADLNTDSRVQSQTNTGTTGSYNQPVCIEIWIIEINVCCQLLSEYCHCHLDRIRFFRRLLLLHSGRLWISFIWIKYLELWCDRHLWRVCSDQNEQIKLSQHVMFGSNTVRLSSPWLRLHNLLCKAWLILIVRQLMFLF